MAALNEEMPAGPAAAECDHCGAALRQREGLHVRPLADPTHPGFVLCDTCTAEIVHPSFVDR